MEKEDVLDIAANETFAPIMLKITTKVKTDIKFFIYKRKILNYGTRTSKNRSLGWRY